MLRGNLFCHMALKEVKIVIFIIVFANTRDKVLTNP